MCRYFALLVFYSKSIDFNCVIFITAEKKTVFVSISLPRPLSYRNQFIDLLSIVILLAHGLTLFVPTLSLVIYLNTFRSSTGVIRKR